MKYVRKIRTSQLGDSAAETRKIKILNGGEVVDIKKSLYCDSNLNLIEIYNINPYCTISFEYVKDNESTPTIIFTWILEKGQTIPIVPAAPNMVGWVFRHWLLGEDTYTETEIKAITVTSDLTFTAYYTRQTFTVKYYNNQELLVEREVTYNNSPITDITTLGITPTTSSEIGYTKEFSGWSLSNNNIPFDFTNYQTKSNLTLYACFSKTPIDYTIIFNYRHPYNGYVEIFRTTAKINDNIFNLKPERPIRYSIGKTDTYIYTNDFSYYKEGSNSSKLASVKTLKATIISTYAIGTTINLSLDYTKIPHSAPVLSNYSRITPDYHGNPLVYFKNKFIAGGKGNVYYNDNPKSENWLIAPLPDSEVSIRGFAHTDSMLIGFTDVSTDMTPEHPQLVYSTSGSRWYKTGAYFGNNDCIACITTASISTEYSYNDDKFILSTMKGMIYTSIEGVGWTYRSTVDDGFNPSDEEICTLTVTKNNILIVGTNKNKSYFTHLDQYLENWSWNKLPDLDSSVTGRSTFLKTITQEGDATLGRVLWLKNYGRVFELRPRATTPYLEWVEVGLISGGNLQKGFIYHNNRYFAVGENGSYAHTGDINFNWTCDLQTSNYNFTSIAAKQINSNYVVALADDTNDSSEKKVFTIDWEPHSLPIYTLNFNSQGGSPIEPIINVNKIPPSLPTPTKAGHRFLGWSFYANGSWAVTAGDDIFRDTTLYAKWEPNT